MAVQMAPEQRSPLITLGRDILRSFHYEHGVNPASRRTEFCRGRLSAWRLSVEAAFGQNAASRLTKELRIETGLSIPHCGLFDEQTNTFGGPDDDADAFVGRLSPAARANRQFDLSVEDFIS
jgi:hypothetical protein